MFCQVHQRIFAILALQSSPIVNTPPSTHNLTLTSVISMASNIALSKDLYAGPAVVGEKQDRSLRLWINSPPASTKIPSCLRHDHRQSCYIHAPASNN